MGQMLAVAGIAAALLGRGRRLPSAVGGAALLASSAFTRFGIFEAGIASANDPRYVVGPQRERVEAGRAADPSAHADAP